MCQAFLLDRKKGDATSDPERLVERIVHRASVVAPWPEASTFWTAVCGFVDRSFGARRIRIGIMTAHGSLLPALPGSE
jgi:hypothetical protein